MNDFPLKGIATYLFITAAVISVRSQSMKLPDLSNVYPDTFAIYWRTDKVKMTGENYSFQATCASIYEDLAFETEKSSDSILSIPFSDEHTHETAMLVHGAFFRNDVKIFERLPQSKTFTILSKSDKIEALKSLVETNASVQNLKLLADAFEDDKCFVNAIHIYQRMILKDRAQGQKYFLDFYKQNYKILNSSTNAVHR